MSAPTSRVYKVRTGECRHRSRTPGGSLVSSLSGFFGGITGLIGGGGARGRVFGGMLRRTKGRCIYLCMGNGLGLRV